jgi:3-deoxy-manno-octulosonate cytidylyltransferase (CMP-KDO synthetase)
MIHRVVKQCLKACAKDMTFEVAVVTDNDEIETSLKEANLPVVRVDDETVSGSERISLAFERHYQSGFDIIINVQGDEPLIDPCAISEMAMAHINSGFDVFTMVRPMGEGSEDLFNNPDKVKAVFSRKTNRCLYFSRSGVPYDRGHGGTPKEWYLHCGVYSFKPEILNRFVNLSPSHYEEIECLEQLRLLENGHTIGAICRNEEVIGVDRPQDITILEGVMREKGIE